MKHISRSVFLFFCVLLTGCGSNVVVNSFTIGGTSTGYTGSGLSLINNVNEDEIELYSNQSFVFAGKYESGDTYSISILSQPVNPSQICTVENGSGTVGAANITNVLVTCSSVE